jgi:hypothetical protein
MKNLITLLVYCLPLLVMGQNSGIKMDQISKEDQVKMAQWYVDVTEKGVVQTQDSIIFSKEFIKVLNNEKYRNVLYPESYKWEIAIYFMKHQQLKQAFWFFINLYSENEKNKEMVIKSILAYDHALKMDEMLVNVFYTYSFMDPEISVIKEGKPEIIRPDILEEKLSHVKEMVAYIHTYRKKKEIAEANKI